MKILLVDDHALFREGMRHILKQLGDDTELLDADNLAGALRMAAASPDLDLVLLDLRIPGSSGIGAIGLFRESFPETPIIMLTGSEERLDVEAALDAGAVGYVPKSSSSQVMLGAIRLVLAGGVYVPPLLLGHSTGEKEQPPGADETRVNHPSDKTVRPHGLTERQLEVLTLLAEGKSNKLIARALDLTEGTVKVHLAAIFRTLNVNNRTEAVIAAQRLSLKPTKAAEN